MCYMTSLPESITNHVHNHIIYQHMLNLVSKKAAKLWGLSVCTYQAGKQEQERRSLVSGHGASRSYSSAV